MIKNMSIIQTSSAMTSYAAQRHAVIAQNIANSDTPGYVAKDLVPFAQAYQAITQAGSGGGIENVSKIDLRSTASTSPNGNNVSLAEQMILSSQVKNEHDLASALYKKTLDMMKLAIGKNL